MFRIVQFLFFICILCFFSAPAGAVDPAPGAKTLVRIDTNSYTGEDFRNWWKNWQEPGVTVPETPDSFVDWMLLAREAREMELDQLPSFQRKMWVFLKSRTLLMLKNEVIDAKISIPEDDLKKMYTERYLPRYEVEILYFNDPVKAATAHKGLISGNLTFANFRESHKSDGADFRYQVQTLRPHTAEKSWIKTLETMKDGGIAQPIAWSKGHVILGLSAKKGYASDDFETFRDMLHTEKWKEQQSELTAALITELEKTYQVKVDEQLLEAIDPSAPLDTFTDAKIITTTRESYSERQFAEMIQNELAKIRAFEGQAPPNAAKPLEENLSEMKKRIVRSVLAQQLTTWAALDRHYEKEAPFKPVFEFYTQHRLIKELEKVLFQSDVMPSQEEIEAYYQANIKDFTLPDRIDMDIFTGTEEQARRVWTATTLGADFSDAVKKYLPHGVQTTSFSAPDLDPAIQAATKKMAADELSQVFAYKDSFAVVKLIGRHAGKTLPLKDAVSRISETLRQKKIEENRTAFINKLKERTAIEISDAAWASVRRDLVE